MPQPGDQLSFQVDGREILRYHLGTGAAKPYFFPVIGPAGHPVTRIGHPHDPVGHGHHLSLWVGHQSVGGQNFWEVRPRGARIIHDRVLKIEDGDSAALTVRARWVDGEGKDVAADERVWRLTPLPGGEFLLDLDFKLMPAGDRLEVGKTAFGFAAVRVAKMMGVSDGGGRITNSEGARDAKDIHWQRARWCDYSGPVAPGDVNGVTLIDHPANTGHPTCFHVRNDGWMGASTTLGGPLEATKEAPLRLRYRFWIHRGGCDPAAANRYAAFDR